MLYIIGLGLGDEKDITLKGQEAIASCSELFLETYTSILGISKERLEKFFGKPITIADRDTVESEADSILSNAKERNVGFLVVGDAFGATTHMDLFVRAEEAGVDVQVIHNASIMNAIGACGLQLYNFGQTITVPFFTEQWRPDSFYEKIEFNTKGGLHTLCLVDIKVKEPDYSALMKGKKVWLPPRFMSVNTCIKQLLEIEEKLGRGAYTKESPCFGVARIGQETQVIVSGTMEELKDVDFGPPLHSFVLAGTMHELERYMYDHYHISKQREAIEKKNALAREQVEYKSTDDENAEGNDSDNSEGISPFS